MSAIYLKHPIHGEKVACEEVEAQRDEANGWVRSLHVEEIEEEPIIEEEESAVVSPQDPTDEEIRAEWAARFGKQPHHKKSVDSLKKELEQ